MHNNPSHRVRLVCERDGIVMEVAIRRETVKVFFLLRQIRILPGRGCFVCPTHDHKDRHQGPCMGLIP